MDDRLTKTIAFLRRKPQATVQDIKQLLGLRTRGVALFYYARAREIITKGA
jgi:hypothetical protein